MKRRNINGESEKKNSKIIEKEMHRNGESGENRLKASFDESVSGEEMISDDDMILNI